MKIRNARRNRLGALALTLVAGLVFGAGAAGTAAQDAVDDQVVVTFAKPRVVPELAASWVDTFQGAFTEDGSCIYSVRFSQPIDQATPQVGWLSKADLKTCTFEVTSGIPAYAVYPAADGEESDETKAASPDVDCSAVLADGDDHAPAGVCDIEGRAAGWAKRLWASAGPAGGLPTVSDRYTHLNKQATVYYAWEDYLGIDVNRVRSRVKDNTSGSTILSATCGHTWWRLSEDGWNRETTGYYAGYGCEATSTYAASWTNGHFYNSIFPACTSTAHTYYDQVVAEVTPYEYHFWVGNIWASGPSCINLLQWYYAWYPGEYW
ncbi:MAG: hypothetical protein KatS3mg059_1681 [Thermomicrobiales bacterium]|nr:MAG: hypothetical protein KatS3mg059_1681 [Thermomicrobiales bacterium]